MIGLLLSLTHQMFRDFLRKQNIKLSFKKNQKQLDKLIFMKKLIVTVAMLVGVSTSQLSARTLPFVKEFDAFQLVNLQGLKFKVKIDTKINHARSIVLKNEAGEIFFAEYLLKKDVFNKVLDLSQLPDGNYTFEVDYVDNIEVKRFKINTKTERQVIND